MVAYFSPKEKAGVRFLQASPIDIGVRNEAAIILLATYSGYPPGTFKRGDYYSCKDADVLEDALDNSWYPRRIMGEIDRTDLDRLLLANANKSIEEISELTGLSPEDAASRLSQLYEDRGVLTDLYRERQLIEDLYDIYGELKTRAASAAERNSAGLYNALRQIITLMFDRLEKARTRNQQDLTTINEFHARVMVEAISLAFEKALFELQKRYPEVDRDELQTIMANALPLALESVDRASE